MGFGLVAVTAVRVYVPATPLMLVRML